MTSGAVIFAMIFGYGLIGELLVKLFGAYLAGLMDAGYERSVVWSIRLTWVCFMPLVVIFLLFRQK